MQNFDLSSLTFRSIPKPYLLSQSLLEDEITVYNLVYPGRTFEVSKTWYNHVVMEFLLDSCHFNVIVSNFKFIPLRPELI